MDLGDLRAELAPSTLCKCGAIFNFLFYNDRRTRSPPSPTSQTFIQSNRFFTDSMFQTLSHWFQFHFVDTPQNSNRLHPKVTAQKVMFAAEPGRSGATQQGLHSSGQAGRLQGFAIPCFATPASAEKGFSFSGTPPGGASFGDPL